MAKTWDTSRTGGGTYEFTQDPHGRYTLRSVGFKGISKLDLPELKTGAAATTAADTSKKDIAALSAQTTQAFGDVAPFYYDQEGRTEDPKYITMRKEDKAERPITYAEARKRMTQDEAYTRPEYSTTRPFGIDTPMKKPVEKEPYLKSREDWYTDVDSPMGPDLKKTIGAKKLPVDYTGESTYYKKVKEAPLGKGVQKISKPSDRQPGFAVANVRKSLVPKAEYSTTRPFGIDTKPKVQKPEIVRTALNKISTGSKTLMKAVGLITNPAMAVASMVMGAVKETDLNRHDKQYFNVDREGGRISGDPNANLYSGMNRVSLKGNLSDAGAKRIATREKAIAKGNVSQKFIDDTNNMKGEQREYNKSKREHKSEVTVQKEAIGMPAHLTRDTGGGRDDGGGKGIICTQMYQQTKLEDWKKTMQLWYIFQKKYLTIEHQEGYHFLFKPFVKGMKKSKILTAIGKYCAIARTKDLKHIMFGTSFSFTGRLVRLVSEPICYLTGKIKSWL